MVLTQPQLFRERRATVRWELLLPHNQHLRLGGRREGGGGGKRGGGEGGGGKRGGGEGERETDGERKKRREEEREKKEANFSYSGYILCMFVLITWASFSRIALAAENEAVPAPTNT